ncbi:MAG: formylglycine-generating enzyme family protein [Bacteroidales bacterium]|nr:formylglycine-generating enzyme family protein [Bacteroidales bacterium]
MNKFSKLLLIVALMCSASVLCSVYATNYYIGFTATGVNYYTATNANLKLVLNSAGASDVVYIAKGTYYLDTQLIVETHIIGGCNPAGDGSESERTAIGAAKSLTSDMTVLDGNSLRHPRRVEKHRVATVNNGGIIENCLIRNGHARGTTNDPNDPNGHGGGVLLNGGKLYNCIIRGNVAMNVTNQISNPSSGGGVYITNNGGQVVNCIIAFNMDDRGVGIDGKSGTSINNTVAWNTQTPTWVNIPSGTFRPFTPSDAPSSLVSNRYVQLSDFYIASTECTGGQYACFMSAIDFDGTIESYLKRADKDSMIAAQAPAAGYSSITVANYALLSYNSAGVSSTPSENMWNLVSSLTNVQYGGCLTNSGTVWFPNTDKAGTTYTDANQTRRRDNYPISYVSWYGGLSFSLWLGGCLPSEAQWEYAARMRGDNSIENTYYYAGATANTETALKAVAWYSANSGKNGNSSTNLRVREVATTVKGTGKGLYDMSGNMYEWVLDGSSGSVNASYPTGTGVTGSLSVAGNLVSISGGTGSSGTPYVNPVSMPSATGSHRVWRGGSWNNSATPCSLGTRTGSAPYSRHDSYGFRAVCVP